MTKAWEKQPYESKISFSHFQKYYLLQPTPRSLTKAYRKFQMEKGGRTPKQIKKLHASGSWNNWAKSRDKDGNRIPNSQTWAERAEEYDSNLFQLKEGDYLEARQKLLQKETVDVQDQLLLWDKLSQSLATHIERLAKAAADEEESFNPSAFVNKAKEFWKWREDIATFQRRTLGMPAIIKEKPISDSKDATKIEWDEPLDDSDEIGIGKEELERPQNDGENDDY